MSDLHRTIVTVKNKLGLHARPAMTLVDIANRFQAAVQLKREDGQEIIDAKSIMQVMTLAAEQGTRIVVETSGPDATDALADLVDVFDRGFDEEM